VLSQGDIDVALARLGAAIRRMRLRSIDVEEAYADAVDYLNHLKVLLAERTVIRSETLETLGEALADNKVRCEWIERKLKEVISRLPPPKENT
jgi:hypothetical protein